MSKNYLYYLFFLIFVSLTKNINSTTVFWELEYSDKKIPLKESGEAYLTINLKEAPKNTINFEHTVIIGIDLEKPDSTFSVKVHKHSSKDDEEVYKINFKSEKEGKNKFKITLYDYESKKSYVLEELVEFEYGEEKEVIEEVIPAPKNTKLTKNVAESYGENDTISFEFSLVDTNGNDIIGNSTFIKKLKILHNGNYDKNGEITCGKDGKTFNLTLKPDYLPLLQEINIEFNSDDKKQKFNLFSDDITTTIKLYPFYLNTEVTCQNCENITINDTPLVDINLFNYKKIPVNNDVFSDLFEVEIEGPLDSELKETHKYNLTKIFDEENLYQILYDIDDILIHSGTYKIKLYGDGFLIKEIEFIINPGFYDLNGFSLKFIDEKFNPIKAYVDTEFGMELKGTDCWGNPVGLSLKDDIEVYLENEKGRKIKFTKRFEDDEKGKLKIYITSETLGYARLRIYYKGEEVLRINKNKHLPRFIFNLVKCVKSELSQKLNKTLLGEEVILYLQCIDKSGNKLKRGGEKFTSENYFIANGKYTSFPVKIKDLKGGNYSFNFIPTVEGSYMISIYLDDKLFEVISFEVEKLHCEGSTPFLCPNKNLCVSNRRDCLEPNNCPEETPFLCPSMMPMMPGKCVESQMDCDCPYGFTRCEYMKYCVPSERLDMCADFSKISEKSCQKLKQFKNLCSDGICRLNKNLSPTQIVCPIGKVLCADLSCRDSYYDCKVSDYCYGKFRCPDQSCVKDYTECPSTISCQNKKYVCPDGTCVDSEIECEGLPICSGNTPYRCHDNLCVKDKNSCSKNVACGQRLALCSDFICRSSCDNI